MPKETVQYPSTAKRHGTELSLHWSKDNALVYEANGYVQIAVTRHVWGPQPEPDPHALCSEGPRHIDHNHCSACADALPHIEEQQALVRAGKLPMMRCDSTDAPPTSEADPPATVYSEPLTRGEINKMITVLRRARDQAYGADA